MKQLFFLLFLSAAFGAESQVPVKLKFRYRNAGEEITLSPMVALNGTSYSIAALGFYVSEVSIIHDGNQQTAIDSVYVFNLDKREEILANIDLTTVEGIKFTVGVPQELNHLDISQYPEGHPLGFQSPSMHWGWSAGYMHFIMSGYGDNNADGQPDNSNPYELHCLGDHNTKQVQISTAAGIYDGLTREIILDVNVDQWLAGTDPATTGAQHGSSGVNAEVMDNVNLRPVFVALETAGLPELQNNLQLSVFQDDKNATVTWDENVAASSFELIDASGKIIGSGSCGKSSVSFTGLRSGLHLVRLYGAKNRILGSAKWIVP